MTEKTMPRIYEFGPFVLDVRERLLLRDGEPLTMTAKMFETLLLLVENCGHALEKEAMMETLWPDSFVEEGSLTKSVSLLRKMLGESAEQHYIETLPRRGYRFVATVRELATDDFDLIVRRRTRARLITSEEVVETQQAGNVASNASSNIANNVASDASSDAASFTSTATLDASATRNALNATSATMQTIAVLPFTLLGAAEGEAFLGLGLADALITQLSNTRRIVVRPTSAVKKYAESVVDSISAGRELKVDAVLEGSIQRAGARLRVTVQMIGVSDGVPLWADKFNADFQDIFEVQDAISEQVAHALTLKLSVDDRARLMKRYTDNTEAYQSYLKGRFFWNRRDAANFKKAITHFNEAIAHDPTYALAFAGLADCYNLLPIWGEPNREMYARGKAAALRALELDDQLAEAHASLGYVLMHYDWDSVAAEGSFKRALELNPNYVTARQWHAKLLIARARFDEARAELDVALELDPLSLMVQTAAAAPDLFARRYDAVSQRCRRILDFEPTFIPALYTLGFACAHGGRHDEAIAAGLKACELSERNPALVAALAISYALAGREREARPLIHEVERHAAQHSPHHHDLASVYACLNDKERAFAHLEHACNEHNGHLIDLAIDPVFDNLRDDARFAALLNRVGWNVT
jgi:TolB-like protein/DNA-binding winged helix-turn-helix (wHTH) protein